MALTLNHWLNLARRRLGLPYWSLSAYLKHKVKNAVQFMDDFERTMADEAKRQGADGVVCGHIHHAELRRIGDILYANDGDWVESCTALVEAEDGTLSVLHWQDEAALSPAQAPEPAPCAYSSSRMLGSLKSMVWSARSTR